MKYLIRFLRINEIDYYFGNDTETIILPVLGLYLYLNGDGTYMIYDGVTGEYDYIPSCASLCHVIRRYDEDDEHL